MTIVHSIYGLVIQSESPPKAGRCPSDASLGQRCMITDGAGRRDGAQVMHHDASLGQCEGRDA